MFKITNIAIITLGLGISSAETTVQWWLDREVFDADQPYVWNSAVASGQLLNFAEAGLAEFNEKLAPLGGAGFTMADFFDESDSSFNAYEAVVAGQAKNVTYRFLDRLRGVGYTGAPLDFTIDPVNGYPWANNGAGADNNDLIVAAQLLNLFSWDLSLNADADGDTIADWYELVALGGMANFNDGTLDADSDGLSLADESAQGRLHDFSDNPANELGTIFYMNNLTGDDTNNGLMAYTHTAPDGPKVTLESTITAATSDSTVIIKTTGSKYTLSTTNITPTSNLTIKPTGDITFTVN